MMFTQEMIKKAEKAASAEELLGLSVTYADKNRDSINVFCPKEYFKELFEPIKKMIPKCEYLPKCLTDYEDDLPF